MPPSKRPGMTGFYVEVPDALAEEFERFVESFPVGTKAQHVRLALRRHMDTPPQVTAAELPAAEMEGAPRTPRAKGKK